MAGDWIKMRGNLWDDPRVSRLCDLTDQSEAAIVGALYWLWATADQHTEDGVMPGLTLRQIDRKTGIQGFGQALCEIKWLADHPEGVAILNFEEHNGSSAKKRCQTAKRVANHKAGNTEVTQEALPETTGSVSSALPREEKRREDIERDISPQKTTRSNQTQVPDDFVPDQSSTASVASAKTAGVDVDHERQMFVLHYQANGEYRSNWQAQFRKWMLQAQQRKADDAKRSNVAQMHGNRRTYEDFRREKVALFGRVDGEAAAKAAFEWQEKQYARAG